MSGPKRMSPLYVVFALLKMLRGLVPLIVIFGVQFLAGGKITSVVYWTGGAALVLLVLAGILESIGWKRFTYEEESDRITIRKGLIQRSEKIIYYSRIHSVSQEQPLIQRLLGVVQLKIETPGGSEGDAVLPVLPRREAERLQRALNERAVAVSAAEPAAETAEGGPAQQAAFEAPAGGLQPWVRRDAGGPGDTGAEKLSAAPVSLAAQDRPAEGGPAPQAQAAAAAGRPRASEPVLLYRLGPGRLFQAALTELNLGLAVAFVAGIASFADDLLPDVWLNRLVSNAQAYLTGIRAILIIAAAALLFAWLLSLVLFIVKFAGFSLYREGERLSIRYGLLERKQFLFDPARVQAVTVREGWLRQLLGYAHVEVNVVSSSSEKETPALHPFIPRAAIPQLLERTIPQFSFAAAEFRPPGRALLGYVRTGLIVTVILAAVLIYFFPHMGRWALALIPLVFALDYWSFRTSGAALDGQRLTIVNRGISKQTHCTLRRHVVALRISGSRWQRKGQMLNLKAHLLGGAGGSALSVPRLKKSDVERIYAWYSRERKS
ncbi:PH domain-containing protein [Saccharibacillus qingshengii]|uniref:PH domain-containing protein n=1 Tax=Saccharibacillus qingshengii TaxID=1763540 RepID=UPI00155555AE|nr:PH domain-containing protein [Saccharibacillus qingshengii]